MSGPRRPECDYCFKLADAEVHAQWSIADFDSCYTCADHLAMGYRKWLRKLVDGRPAMDIWHYWFDDATRASAG